MIYLDFEKNIKELDDKIESLKLSNTSDENKNERIEKKLERYTTRKNEELLSVYGNLSSWQKVQIARHPDRPHTLDYINGMISDFVELSGDRCFADDNAIIGGIGYLDNLPVMIIGQERGYDTESRLKHNFGMSKPEGYRKVIRLLELADKFSLPVITLVDTAGAYPGMDAEARGQAQAIASSIEKCFNINVPSVCVVIGEGGSGGAIAMAVANSIIMLENSVYSVISPEGCASILWRSQDFKEEATKSLKITAQDLLCLKLIDKVVEEGVGGAHRNKDLVIKSIKTAILNELKKLFSLKDLKKDRETKFLDMTRNLF